MTAPITVYAAILNSGWLRREVVSTLLPQMYATDGVDLLLENPALTWSNPISSNRNLIAKRFLAHAKRPQFLLMLDDDVVPQCNPLHLIRANKPVIGCPTKVRSPNRLVCWNAYVEQADHDGYRPINMRRAATQADLAVVDIVGTGCILIRRDVLDTIKAPFSCEFDDDGVQTYGTDFAFCRRAKAAGFDVYVAPWFICEHVKDGFGLNDMTGWDDVDNISDANGKYDWPWGGYAIQSRDWEFLRKVVADNSVKTVLEFGSGLSSLLLSEYCRVTSYETDGACAQRVRDKTDTANQLVVMDWDGLDCREFDGVRYDMAFVDGPRGKAGGGPGRDLSIAVAARCSDLVVVHDGGREDEMQAQMRHLRPGFDLVDFNGRHQSRCNCWRRRERTA